MKQIKKIVLLTLAICVCAQLSCYPILSVKAKEQALSQTKTTALQGKAVEGLSLIDENDKLSLFADTKTGLVCLLNKSTNYMWRSNPDTTSDQAVSKGQKRLLESQIDIKYYDEKSTTQERNSKIACVDKNGLTFEIKDKKIVFNYNFTDENIVIPVEYSLGTDFLSANVVVDDVKESGKNQLAEISLLPYFASASTIEEGYIFIPDGSGAVINFNNGKENGTAYKQRIYGEDIVSAPDQKAPPQSGAKMPVLGINKGDNAVMCVMNKGAALSYANAYVSGMKRNYNAAYFSFEYRPSDRIILDSSSYTAKEVSLISEKKAQIEKFEARYYPLEQKTSYSDMAIRYKKYLMDEKELKKERDMPQNVPFYVNSYGAVEKRGSIFWIPTNIIVPLTTYEQASNMIVELKNSGIENIVFSYEAWTKGGLSGKIATKGKYESKLGNKKDFTKLVNTAKEKGATFLPEVNIVDFYKSGNGYTKTSKTAKTLNGSPSLQFTYNLFSLVRNNDLKSTYLIAPKYYNDILSGFFKSYKQDLSGISIKKLGDTLYSDYGKNYCDRIITNEMVKDTLLNAKKSCNSVLTKAANDYAFASSDYIIDAPTSSSGFDIQDYSVPFYQIVLSGLRSSSGESVNLGYNTQHSLLKAIETGTSLYYDFNAQNFDETGSTYIENVYNSNYKDWSDTASKQYQQLNSVYKYIKDSEIINHQAVADGVYKTTYKNGVQIFVNYNLVDYAVENINVKSNDYLLIK